MKNFNLHTIVRLPEGVFAPYTDIPANLLFFDRSGSTSEIWYYQIPLPEGRKKYSKTKPMEYAEFSVCLQWWNKREENEHAWKVALSEVLKYGDDDKLIAVNLDIKNPHSLEALEHRPPEELVAEMLMKEQQVMGILEDINRKLEVSLHE